VLDLTHESEGYFGKPLGKILSPSACGCCSWSLVYWLRVLLAAQFLNLWVEVLGLLLCFEYVGDEVDVFDGGDGEVEKEAHPHIAACRDRKAPA